MFPIAHVESRYRLRERIFPKKKPITLLKFTCDTTIIEVEEVRPPTKMCRQEPW